MGGLIPLQGGLTDPGHAIIWLSQGLVALHLPRHNEAASATLVPWKLQNHNMGFCFSRTKESMYVNYPELFWKKTKHLPGFKNQLRQNWRFGLVVWSWW